VNKKLAVQKVSITVAAMVGWNFKSKLVILPRSIDGDEYVQYFLEPVVKPFFEKQRAEVKSNKTMC
jgi:hypothetical protein